MTARLAGRAAIVTGASRGLGRATALALAAEGAAVAVVARTEQQWDERLPGTIGETVAAIEAAGGRAVAIAADLLDRDDLPRLVEQARAALGPITVLVNNAAFTAPGRPPKPGAPAKPAAAKPAPSGTPNADWPGFLSVPLAAYRRHFEIGPFASYELTQLVCPDMIAGVATGGIAHGALVAHDLGLPFIYVRSGAKDHGMKNQVEGDLTVGRSVVVVEDLVSTGQSSLNAVEALRAEGCDVKGMVSIFTYGFDEATKAFAKAKV